MKSLFANCVLVTFFLLQQGGILGQNLGQLSFGSDDAFEVATWNLEAFPKAGTTTVDSVRKAITALDFDVLGLQEIADTAALRQMVNEMPGFGFFIADGFYAGLAYVYKTDFISIQSIYKIYDSFPYWNIFPRTPVLMELTYQGESLIVINNHLKCCGDGLLDEGNEMDEENRRYQATLLLKEYIDTYLPETKVMVIGDLNDLLTDIPSHNVFQEILDDSANYLFADLNIAEGSPANWSYPLWPSHLDHILITDDLFNDFFNLNSTVQVIQVDNYLPGGLWQYDTIISDHRPVAMKIDFDPTTNITNHINANQSVVFPNPTSGTVFIQFEEPTPSVNIQLIDVRGSVVREWQECGLNQLELDIAVPAGAYTLRILAKGSMTQHRVLKR